MHFWKISNLKIVCLLLKACSFCKCLEFSASYTKIGLVPFSCGKVSFHLAPKKIIT